MIPTDPFLRGLRVLRVLRGLFLLFLLLLPFACSKNNDRAKL